MPKTISAFDMALISLLATRGEELIAAAEKAGMIRQAESIPLWEFDTTPGKLGGLVTADQLRDIADELDRRNAELIGATEEQAQPEQTEAAV